MSYTVDDVDILPNENPAERMQAAKLADQFGCLHALCRRPLPSRNGQKSLPRV
jgi:hypothetical protein